MIYLWPLDDEFMECRCCSRLNSSDYDKPYEAARMPSTQSGHPKPLRGQLCRRATSSKDMMPAPWCLVNAGGTPSERQHCCASSRENCKAASLCRSARPPGLETKSPCA